MRRLGRDGQSMAEMVVALPILLMLIFAIIYLADVAITTQQALVFARQIAWSYEAGKVPSGFAKDGYVATAGVEVKTVVCEKGAHGEYDESDIQPSGVTATIKDMMGFLGFLLDLLYGTRQATVEVEVKPGSFLAAALDPLLKITNIEPVKVRGQHVVDSSGFMVDIAEMLDSFIGTPDSPSSGGYESDF